MENMLQNAENTKDEGQRLSIPVVNKTQTWPEQLTQLPTHLPHLQLTQSHLAPYYTHYYQQYLQQFVPYYYNLLNYNLLGYSQPSRMPPTDMDLEKYINYELSRQQNRMNQQQHQQQLRQQQQQQHPQQRLQQPQAAAATSSARSALVPQSVPPPAPPGQIVRKFMPQPKRLPQKRVLNVRLMAVTSDSSCKPTIVEPLPPVETSFKERVSKIQKSQDHYMQLFGRLTTVLQTLNRRYTGAEPEPEPESEENEQLAVVPATVETPPPPLKRPRHESSSSSSCASSNHTEAEPAPHSQYPQRVQLADGSFSYLLGPNGTQITAQQYGQIFWTDAPVATRCLLSVIFTSDELATHTLTGKPSPAFYGRERPAKKMLDPARVDDIVVSVRNRTGGKERHIRATITTKCADTAKKYKRRAKKALKD